MSVTKLSISILGCHKSPSTTAVSCASSTSRHANVGFMSTAGCLRLGIPLSTALECQNLNHSLCRSTRGFRGPCRCRCGAVSRGKNLTGAGLKSETSHGFYLTGPKFRIRLKWACHVLRGMEKSFADLGSENDDDDGEWTFEMPVEFARARSTSGRHRQDMNGESTDRTLEEEKQVDWSSKARERAIRAIQERGLPVASLLKDGKKRKKTKEKKIAAPLVQVSKVKLEKVNKLVTSLADKMNGADISENAGVTSWMERMGIVNDLQELAGLRHNMNGGSNAWKMQLKNVGRQGNVDNIRQDVSNKVLGPSPKIFYGGPQVNSTSSKLKRQEDLDLNRMLIAAADAPDILSIISDVIGDNISGQDECPLSTVNVSTALHRIAKNMEAVSMPKSERLAFARQKLMAHLVSVAIESLSLSSAQSVSNVAWALSKVGGNSLYWSEMDIVAQVAVQKVSEFEPQQIANIAGALASMQHSVPPLFEAFDHRASLYHYSFQSQELAQLLWAFATLNQPAKLLLDSLDLKCKTVSHAIDCRHLGPKVKDLVDVSPCSHHEHLEIQEDMDDTLNRWSNNSSASELQVVTNRGSASVSPKEYFRNCSLSQLASLSWSYTALGELKRPSFALIWDAILNKLEEVKTKMKSLPDPSLQLSQLYQTNLSLQLEYPELQLSLSEPFATIAQKDWEKMKHGTKLSSVTQLDVGRLLVGMGRSWVSECTDADYSLDAALLEEKIGLEIDGPSHFTRNTGAPLGHTLLKRRQLSAAGWTVLSIPYEEWDEQQGEKEQRRFLYNLLANHLQSFRVNLK